ncbi:MAG TPA: hypothetical protein VFJ30_14790, partial [Phycisphaerae bacterium]|nr:hypothetical protein [Phycisphaerae bacterium]
LVTILMPSLGRAMELARRTKCKTNLHAMGGAWYMYWTDNDYRFPGINFDGGNTNRDTISMSCLYIMQNNKIINTGLLWQAKLINGPDIFVCPTTERSTADPWFDDQHGAYPPWRSANPWPPNVNGYRHCRMTYATRRMNYYSKADVGGSPPNVLKEEPYMLRQMKMCDLADPSGFTFMADNINGGYMVVLSHYPGVCVMYADGHAGFFEDKTDDGRILYDGNGLVNASHVSSFNFAVDRIWMVIDGKMDPLADTLK